VPYHHWERRLASSTTESPIFKVRISTSAMASILRAPTEREVTPKAELLIRKVHAAS
jgi:hypothetical protein